MLSDDDLRHLRRCLELAARGRATTAPNPCVGSVIVRDGEVVGEGWHRRAGGPHAEIDALRAAGQRARGATAYVSLEPCAHHGRTPPCADALVEAGVARVVACHRDPDPRVAGGGFARLEAAGIEVAWGGLVDEAVRLNWRFLAAIVQRRPAVTLKWAMSLDGKIATHTGDSQWISSPEGRQWALELREEHDAILVGSGTALADDPRLTRRLGQAEGPIVRIVLDRRLRLAPTARLFTVDGPVLVYTEAADTEVADTEIADTEGADTETAEAARATRREELTRAGAEVVVLERVEPTAVLGDLARRGVQSLLVEGGGSVAAAFAEAAAFDRVAVCCAPRLLGGETAPGPLRGSGFATLAEAPRLADLQVTRRGPDLVFTAFRETCLQDLFKSVVD
ncbi:MAG: bifunctional diaminohydroxyphosphoribosylaminopyrimidine deaminase/5-amino-6-(5-phosphoribosylamino)uracil reductase RibD [Acidobacteriota bacterium]